MTAFLLLPLEFYNLTFDLLNMSINTNLELFVFIFFGTPCAFYNWKSVSVYTGLIIGSQPEPQAVFSLFPLPCSLE